MAKQKATNYSISFFEKVPRIALHFEFEKNLCFKLNTTQYSQIISAIDYFSNFNFLEQSRKFKPNVKILNSL